MSPYDMAAEYARNIPRVVDPRDGRGFPYAPRYQRSIATAWIKGYFGSPNPYRPEGAKRAGENLLTPLCAAWNAGAATRSFA